MPSAKANFILNSDVYSIHAVNVIDSHHLGLISEPLARSYLATLAEGALNAPKGEHEMDVVDRVWREWAKSVSSDTREAVKLARNSEWGTAMVDAAFKRRFAATFSALSASAAKITKSGSSHVDLQKMAASLRRLRKLPELVLTDPLTLWMAPKSRPRLSADQYRDRLGLPHLPRLGSADYGARLLLRVSFDSAEFAASGILARRPCHLDFPGIRFRAFCRNESDKSRAKKPRKVGKTASLESGFPDGFDELIFQLPPDAPIKKWKVKNLGELTGRHANADRHGEFADHLRKRNSKNKNLCKYHFGPLSQQVLSNELERLLM